MPCGGARGRPRRRGDPRARARRALRGGRLSAAPRRAARWSIGLYAGPSPFALGPAPDAANPLLTASDVGDAAAAFVADPFLVRLRGLSHVFLEVMDERTKLGAIGWATAVPGRPWRYQGIVLREAWHLSYPSVFRHGGEVFMTPEGLDGGVRLYRADPFPTRWRPVAVLVPDRVADPSLVFHEGRFWLFACGTPESHDSLRLWSSSALDGAWREHPRSPLVTRDPRRARPAGRPFVYEGALHRLAQDCDPFYGRGVRAFRIEALDASRYEEAPEALEVLAPAGDGWNGRRMHHADLHACADGTWIACVDGSAD